MAAEGFRTFDHTGDLGLEVWAEAPERLYALAAEAVMAQIARPRTADAAVAPSAGEAGPGNAPLSPDRSAEPRAEVTLEGEDPEDLLVHWLNTAILEAELQHAVWTRAEVLALGPRTLRARLSGMRLDRTRVELLREIKAVSHHFLELDLAPRASRCRLVLDL